METKFYVPITNDTPRDHADAVGYITLDTLGENTKLQQPVFWVDPRETVTRLLVHLDGAWCWIETNAPIHFYDQAVTNAPPEARGFYTAAPSQPRSPEGV